MPTLTELLASNARAPVPDQGAYQQPNSLSALLMNLLRTQGGQQYGNAPQLPGAGGLMPVADRGWEVRGGLDTRVNSGQPAAAPTPQPFSRDQNADGLVRALMARGIPEPQARAMAMQKLQGR